MTLPTSWRFARLVVLQNQADPDKITLEKDICMIGRSPACHVVVSRPITSRLHATIKRDSIGHYVLHDNDSANGTFINEHPQPIQKPHSLKHGDRIGLGTATPDFRFEDEEATTQVTTTRLTYDDLTLTFYLDNQPVKLTANQLRLMQHLYAHAYDLCTRKSCAEVLWERSYDPILDDRPLDRTISNIRKLLRKIAPKDEFIVTRRGIGYILTLDV